MEEELCAVGLTRQRFALRGLRRAAETFQQDPQFALDKAGLVIGSEMPADLSERVLEAARREVRAAGAGQAADLCAGLAGVYGFQIGPATVWHVLERERDFTCLDKAAGWYCLMDVRNPVVSRVFKLLSVVPRVTESCFRELMGKGWRRNGGKIHGFAPPEVLWKLCGQLAWCRVNDGILEATGPLEPSTLSKAERVLVGILRNHGGVLQGAELSRYAGEA